MSQPNLILLAPISFLALLTLVSPKPSLSAVLMFAQAILIAYFLSLQDISIILCVFCIPVIIANIYIEKSLPRYSTTPTLNFVLGILLFLCFGLFASRLKNLGVNLKNSVSNPEITNFDLISITGIIFMFFSIIISACSVINNKNSQN